MELNTNMANETPKDNDDGVTLPHVPQASSHNARPGSNGFSARKDPNDSSSTSPPPILLRGWSKQYRRPITLAELQEINGNLAHFFSLVLSWEKQFKEQGLLSEADESKETTV